MYCEINSVHFHPTMLFCGFFFTHRLCLLIYRKLIQDDTARAKRKKRSESKSDYYSETHRVDICATIFICSLLVRRMKKRSKDNTTRMNIFPVYGTATISEKIYLRAATHREDGMKEKSFSCVLACLLLGEGRMSIQKN